MYNAQQDARFIFPLDFHLTRLVTADSDVAYDRQRAVLRSVGLGYRLCSTNDLLLPLGAGKINIIGRTMRTSHRSLSVFLWTRANHLGSRRVNPR